MTLVPPEYRPRLLDAQIKRCLRIFGAVQIDGAKWTGKTWAALAHASSSIHLDEQSVRTTVNADHQLALMGEPPHLIDEWQEVPGVRDAIRRAVDASGSLPGSYLLTGSSTPQRTGYSHSGAGRIAQLRMRPMTLFEQGLSDSCVSLSSLFNQEFRTASSDSSLAQIADWICHGGWPATLSMTTDDAQYVSRQYLSTILNESAPRQGKSPETARRLLASLARNIATSATINTLSSDMAAGEEDNPSAKPARNTVDAYLEFFREIFILEDIPGWDFSSRSKKRVRTKPRRYLVDPSLAVSLLGQTPQTIVYDGQLFGLLFENLCMRELLVYVSTQPELLDARISYYHDDTNLEVDVIIELPDGRWGAIEIKLGEDKAHEGAASLLRFARTVEDGNLSKIRPPAFLLLLVGKATFAHRRPDGVCVVPLSCLSP